MNSHFPLKFCILLYVLQLLFNVRGSKPARPSWTAETAQRDKDDKLLAKSQSAITTSHYTKHDFKTFTHRDLGVNKFVFYMAH